MLSDCRGHYVCRIRSKVCWSRTAAAASFFTWKSRGLSAGHEVPMLWRNSKWRVKTMEVQLRHNADLYSPQHLVMEIVVDLIPGSVEPREQNIPGNVGWSVRSEIRFR